MYEGITLRVHAFVDDKWVGWADSTPWSEVDADVLKSSLYSFGSTEKENGAKNVRFSVSPHYDSSVSDNVWNDFVTNVWNDWVEKFNMPELVESVSNAS